MEKLDAQLWGAEKKARWVLSPDLFDLRAQGYALEVIEVLKKSSVVIGKRNRALRR